MTPDQAAGKLWQLFEVRDLDQMNGGPFERFGVWLEEAKATEPNDPNAMILATAGANGQPAARTVLLRAWDERGFVFYTNLESRKSDEIGQNAQVALLFYWKLLHRQIRIEGTAVAVEAAQADEYFAGRPRRSQIGAWASAQSRALPSRETFEAGLTEVETRFADAPVPRPPFWSGWRVMPARFEFWQDQQYRLHDRDVYVRDGAGWTMGKLYP
jgi:pyridoxamine 5'-phosphate oxidase